MKPKYDIGDKVWVVEANYHRNDVYKPDFVTIEDVEEVTKKNNYLFGRKLKIGSFTYKMKEGCSYWRADDTIFMSEKETSEAIA